MTTTTPLGATADASRHGRRQAVVCLDGSTRSAEALRPALDVARSPSALSVVVLHGDRPDVRSRVHDQLVGIGAASVDPTIASTTNELLALVHQLAQAGATPVLSAFGRWSTPGQLVGLVGDLVRGDIARVLAVGPKVAPHRPSREGPIIAAVDTVCRVEPLIDATQDFVTDRTNKVVVAHIVSPGETGVSYAATREGAKFSASLKQPVDIVAVTDASISNGIAKLALEERAALIIVRSWHRTLAHRPGSASSSLSIVAEAPCPVLIVN